jgi:hypothetical protein
MNELQHKNRRKSSKVKVIELPQVNTFKLESNNIIIHLKQAISLLLLEVLLCLTSKSILVVRNATGYGQMTTVVRIDVTAKTKIAQ